MKKYLFLPLFLITIFACSKDPLSNCETVINPNGPSYIIVENNYGQTVLVYFGDFGLAFGAELKSGVCEKYGVPVDNRAVEISTLNGSQTRDVQVDAQSGKTTTITVGPDFF